MAMQLRELDVLQKTSSLHDVWEAAESIVEVLKSWPFENDFTIPYLLLEEFVQFNER